jgi:hypothetical protein
MRYGVNNDNLANIKDTIAKLLALGGSPYEHEAKSALLKARQLMVKYKLHKADIRQSEDVNVVRRLTGITCTKMTNTWAVQLSSIIAGNYCCRSYRQHTYKSKKVTIGLVGLEDDLDICEKVLAYAFDSVLAECGRIQKMHKNLCKRTVVRQMENAYGFGFCNGVRQAYIRQNAGNEEFGLVLITPQAVADAMSEMKAGKPYGSANYDGWRKKFAQQGYSDGVLFSPSTKLPGNCAKPG